MEKLSWQFTEEEKLIGRIFITEAGGIFKIKGYARPASEDFLIEHLVDTSTDSKFAVESVNAKAILYLVKEGLVKEVSEKTAWRGDLSTLEGYICKLSPIDPQYGEYEGEYEVLEDRNKDIIATPTTHHAPGLYPKDLWKFIPLRMKKDSRSKLSWQEATTNYAGWIVKIEKPGSTPYYDDYGLVISSREDENGRLELKGWIASEDSDEEGWPVKVDAAKSIQKAIERFKSGEGPLTFSGEGRIITPIRKVLDLDKVASKLSWKELPSKGMKIIFQPGDRVRIKKDFMVAKYVGFREGEEGLVELVDEDGRIRGLIYGNRHFIWTQDQANEYLEIVN